MAQPIWHGGFFFANDLRAASSKDQDRNGRPEDPDRRAHWIVRCSCPVSALFRACSRLRVVVLNLAISSTEVADRVKVVMFRLLALAAPGVFLLASYSAHAQVVATAPENEAAQYGQRWDFYGGAQYSHFNPSPGRGIEAINLLGWNGTVTAWMGGRFGIDGTARGLYGTLVVPATDPVTGASLPTNPQMSEHLFMFGPNIRIARHRSYTFGMHGAIGAAYGQFSQGFPSGSKPQDVGIFNDKLAVGLGVGSWADFNLSPRLSVRVITDWQPTHYGFTWQNEFAGSAGIVYKFGSLHSK